MWLADSLPGVICGKRYRANESYCKFCFYFVLTLAFVKTGRLTYVRSQYVTVTRVMVIIYVVVVASAVVVANVG